MIHRAGFRARLEELTGKECRKILPKKRFPQETLLGQI
jgi:hypothetical protein